MKTAYVTTAKCPDGAFFGAAWRADNTLIAMSPALPTRNKARSWARHHLR